VGASIVLPTPDAVTSDLLTQANVNAGVLKVNASTNTYTRLPVDYVHSPWMFQVTLPSPIDGQYATAAINEYVNASANVAIKAPANCNQTFAWTVNGAIDLTIQFMSQWQNSITVTPQSTPPSHPPPSQKGAFVSAHWSVTLASANASQTSNVAYTYTDQMVSAAATAANDTAVSAQKLIFMYFDSAANAWTSVTTNINTNTRVASCTTTHFSDWSIYYSAQGSGSALHAQLSLVLVLSMLVLGAVL